MEVIPADKLLCLAAMASAGRLGLSKAYDRFYLALAVRYYAELWTADRLFRNREGNLASPGCAGFRRSGRWGFAFMLSTLEALAKQ